MLFYGSMKCDAKKIRNSFTIEKTAGSKTNGRNNTKIKGIKVNLSDTVLIKECDLQGIQGLNFAGYDKEPNSTKESFILVNPTNKTIKGYEVKIDYLDMQNRMLHSKVHRQSCEVPPGENRRFDLSSWDLQRTYYYYLGNEPKKVATPFKVAFTPLTIWIEQ